jgi:cell division protein FtsL
VLGAATLLVTVVYLAVSAQATGTSYQLNQLQAEQTRLQSQQGQLNYQEAMLHTPARVQVAAQHQGLVRPTTYQSVAYQPVTFDVYQPIGQSRPDLRPLWQQLLEAVVARLISAVSPGSGARG